MLLACWVAALTQKKSPWAVPRLPKATKARCAHARWPGRCTLARPRFRVRARGTPREGRAPPSAHARNAPGATACCAHCFLHHSEHKHIAHSAACSCTPARSRCAARPWPCRPACACARAGTACPQRCTREKARREQKCRRMACARVANPASVKPACACVCEYALHIREHACMPGRAAREASTTRPRCF